jgi:uncharacterized protein
MKKRAETCSGEAAGTIAAVPGKAIAAVDLRGVRHYLEAMTETLPLNTDALTRIADALERLSPPVGVQADLGVAEAFVWQAADRRLAPVKRINRVDLELLKGIDRNRDILLANTERFARGLPANNALLWGARGMGKSSLVKAIHGAVNAGTPESPVKLVEIHREDVETLPALLNLLRGVPHRVILFCDDLSFDLGDSSYKALKAALEGGVEGRPENVLFYATSNRRHLMPREMIENERSTAINPGEAVEEKVSLSDRFGIWLGFHPCSQDDYWEMIRAYARQYDLDIPLSELRSEALEWAATRGSRSGRTAWQFILDLAGRMGVKLS